MYICVGYMGKYTRHIHLTYLKARKLPSKYYPDRERERVHRVFQASDSLFEFVYIWFYLIILIVKQSTHFDFENESSLMLNLKVICVRTLLCCSHGSTFGYSLSLSVSWKHSSTKWCQPTDPDRNLLQGPLQAWYLTNISVLDWLVVLCLQHNQFLIIIPGCLLGSTSFKQIIWCLFYTYIYIIIYIVRYIWLVGCFKHVSVF